jgi:alpha-mannosidase
VIPARHSIVSVTPGPVTLSAVLRDDAPGDALIVRLYNRSGQPARAEVQFGFGVSSVDRVNLLHGDPQPVALTANDRITVEVNAWQIVTLRVRPR